MDKRRANDLLRFHSDFSKKNSFLYCIKENRQVDERLFIEIMNCLLVLSDNLLDFDSIKNIYSIIFWCRSWIDAGTLFKGTDEDFRNKLVIYIEIIENSLYYLMCEDKEEAFWVYNEFLDGRYH